VPHASTLFRQMKQMGFSYRRPEFRDPNQRRILLHVVYSTSGVFSE
jgi:hypothetical protein